MAQVEWSDEAVAALDSLVRSHTLPADTRARMRRSLRPLERFPRLGVEIPRAGSEVRFLVGPWRWLVIVYVYFADEDRVVVVTAEDGRSSTALTSQR